MDALDGKAGPAVGALAPAVGGRRRRAYYWFIYPSILVMGLVILFPWVFTVFMSLNDWGVASPPVFIGPGNYLGLLHDDRFLTAIWRTFYYTILGVLFPVLFGTCAALVFHQQFPLRSFLRGIFILPMMATPVAVALIWAMIFHPQLGVLNYLLSLVHLPPSLWIYAPDTVIPSLALVETWEWTPLVMLIVVGGLAAIPTDPYESATIDGASSLQIVRYITLPLTMPFIMVAAMLRTIDALKAFDIIYASTQGGPGTASETINIYLYLEAFAYYKVGYASAVVVVFFALIVGCALAMLSLRQKTLWT